MPGGLACKAVNSTGSEAACKEPAQLLKPESDPGRFRYRIPFNTHLRDGYTAHLSATINPNNLLHFQTVPFGRESNIDILCTGEKEKRGSELNVTFN